MIDEDLYQQAADELNNNQRRPHLWARACALASDDHDEARFLYTNLRVEELLAERESGENNAQRSVTEDSSTILGLEPLDDTVADSDRPSLVSTPAGVDAPESADSSLNLEPFDSNSYGVDSNAVNAEDIDVDASYAETSSLPLSLDPDAELMADYVPENHEALDDTYAEPVPAESDFEKELKRHKAELEDNNKLDLDSSQFSEPSLASMDGTTSAADKLDADGEHPFDKVDQSRDADEEMLQELLERTSSDAAATHATPLAKEGNQTRKVTDLTQSNLSVLDAHNNELDGMLENTRYEHAETSALEKNPSYDDSLDASDLDKSPSLNDSLDDSELDKPPTFNDSFADTQLDKSPAFDDTFADTPLEKPALFDDTFAETQLEKTPSFDDSFADTQLDKPASSKDPLDESQEWLDATVESTDLPHSALARRKPQIYEDDPLTNELTRQADELETDDDSEAPNFSQQLSDQLDELDSYPIHGDASQKDSSQVEQDLEGVPAAATIAATASTAMGIEHTFPLDLTPGRAGKEYAIYRRDQKARAVKKGVSWSALFFTLPCLLYRKLFGTALAYIALWVVAIGGLVISGLAWIDAGTEVTPIVQAATIGFALLAFIGLLYLPFRYGNQWQADKLENRGFDLVAHAKGKNPGRAIARARRHYALGS